MVKAHTEGLGILENLEHALKSLNCLHTRLAILAFDFFNVKTGSATSKKPRKLS
jgi:hypothetical protein